MKNLRSYQAKLFYAFSAIALVLACWVLFYFFIQYRTRRLDGLVAEVNELRSEYLLKSRYLQNFLLSGHHQSSFYAQHKQKDIDSFETYLHTSREAIDRLAIDFKNSQIQIQSALSHLAATNENVTATISKIKSLYRLKGFKDFGAEGQMRFYAHIIEDSGMIPETEILKLRRHEKDFLLRGDDAYARKFILLADQLIANYRQQAQVSAALNNYKDNFQKLVKYSNEIGIFSEQGVYAHLKLQTEHLLETYLALAVVSHQKVEASKEVINFVLYTGSTVFFILLILTAWRLSNYLTQDIRELNSILLSYIHSGFKHEGNGRSFAPRILEVQTLHRSFLLLKKKLAVMLEDKMNHQKRLVSAVLEGQEKERKYIGAELHDNINPMLATVKLYLTAQAADEEQKKMMVKEAAGIIDASITEVRKLSHSLVGPHTLSIELNDALHNLMETVEAGVNFHIQAEIAEVEEELLSEEQKLTIYRIVQEQLMNIVKYAGAQTVNISLTQKDKELILLIKDDGIGFDTNLKTKGIGLRNMETRLELVNGSLHLFSMPGAGCQLKASIPLRA